jgi:hypothetical protein
MLMLSGITIRRRYPRTAHIRARPIPVFPLVGSMMTVSESMIPRFSASAIIAEPIRSFTELQGLKNSSLPTTVAAHPSVTRLSFTSGVLPMSSLISAAIFMMCTPVTCSFSSRRSFSGRWNKFLSIIPQMISD